MSDRDILAFVGVWLRGDKAYFVRRSCRMENHAGQWSLPSVQLLPGVLSSDNVSVAVVEQFRRLSGERFRKSPISVKRFLICGREYRENIPRPAWVDLRLYEIAFDEEPRLDPEYYVEGRWMTLSEYRVASDPAAAGLCCNLLERFMQRADA